MSCLDCGPPGRDGRADTGAVRAVACLFAILWFLVYSTAPAASAEPAARGKPPANIESAAVVVDGRPLFRVAGTTAYPADKRAAMIAARIAAVARDEPLSVDVMTLMHKSIETVISVADKPLLSLVEADARLAGAEREVLAKVVRDRIMEAITDYRNERSADYLTRNFIRAFVVTMLMVLVLWGLRRGLVRLGHALCNHFMEKFRATRHQETIEAIQPGQIIALIRGGAILTWWICMFVLLYLYLERTLSRFPWTRQASNWLLDLIISPLNSIGRAVVDFVPDLAFLLILFVLVRYLLRLIELYFLAVASGSVQLEGFEREWAIPTFRLLRFGMIAFAVVVAFPYLPGSSSEAFKGVSVFIGVLFSIGSSSIISNTLAGYSLLYRRAFRVGDRVKIGEHVGDIMAVRQQVTLLRTPKNEDVLIPNSTILGGDIINYTAQAREGQLLLHTSVTIGYDTPWRQVEAILLAAAHRTPGLLTDPPPFVLERALGDFYVEYELNACCDDAAAMPRLYAALHRNILDQFNEHGVQIMSPHFETQPDKVVVVPKDQWFAPPAASDNGEVVRDNATRGGNT